MIDAQPGRDAGTAAPGGAAPTIDPIIPESKSMSMKEARKKRRESSRAALRSVAAAPSFKAAKKRSSRTKVRRGLIIAAFAGAMVVMLMATAKTARADFNSVPEIDPGSMAGALTLLAGGVLALTDRARRA